MRLKGNCNKTKINLNGTEVPKEEELIQRDYQKQQKCNDGCETDDMFTEIGLGRWQILPILVAFLYQAASPTQLISSVFTNMPLDFRLVPVANNTSTFDNSSVFTNMPLDFRMVPLANNTSTFDNTCMGTDHSDLDISGLDIEFDHSLFKSTFTSEFELVCNKDWISTLYQLSISIGLSIGSLLGGIGDKMGRVFSIRLGALGCLLGVLLVGFGINVYMILIGRLITGFFLNILNVSSLSFAMENAPAERRSTICLFIMIAYPISVVLKGIISYFLQKWRELHLTISFFIYFIVILSFFLDKSLRWLLQNGKFDEGITLLEKILKLHNSNKKVADFEPFINKWKTKHTFAEIEPERGQNLCKQLKQSITIFFKNRAMICISLTTPAIWFITGLVYFGVPMNAHNFTDNPYIYMVLLGVAEVISIIIGGMILEKFGNIRTGAVLFTMTGSCLVSIVFVPENLWWLKWVLIIIAMMSINVCYAICCIIGVELYPTQLRAAGLGICNFFCFIGFSLSAFLSKIALKYGDWVFNVVCSVLCFIAVVLMLLLLPETKGEALCDTTDDVSERNKRLRANKIII